jgi:type VI secretion system secreted protein VgrG
VEAGLFVRERFCMTLSARFVLLLCLLGWAGAGLDAQIRYLRYAPLEVPDPVRLSVSTPLGTDALLLEAFRGRESISSLFSFQLDLVASTEQEVRFEALLGKDILVTLALPGGATRHFSGIVSRLTQGARGTVTRYRAEVVPRFWLLTRRSRSRAFLEQSVPQILSRVLADIPGLEFESRLEGTFHPRSFTVQYRETDFSFASRLMEEEGIYYFFDHTENGHTMVLANTTRGHPDLPGPIPFRPAGGASRQASIESWDKAQELRSGKYTLWDHSFELPGNRLEATAAIQGTVAAGQVLHNLAIPESQELEIYDYPGEYAKRFDGIDPGGGERPAELAKIFEDAQRTVRIRMEEEAARSLAIRGASTVASLEAGHRFAVAGHFNADGQYVLTAVEHNARSTGVEGGPGSYLNTFTCIPSGLPFRPHRTTPKPVIHGPQTAIVVGPPGEEIFTDKYGRVKVQFHWDREGAADETSSCWVRVGALNAGTELGVLHIPRIGQEVVVSFLEGDPDRPIITGSVFNARHLPPPVR